MFIEFIRCKNNIERLRMIENTSLFFWTAEDLNSILIILGVVDIDPELTNEDKFHEVCTILHNTITA